MENWWARPGTAPYLILQGMNDRQSPPENAVLMKEKLGDRATVIEFPDGGHLLVVEAPEEAASAIVSFLSSLP